MRNMATNKKSKKILVMEDEKLMNTNQSFNATQDKTPRQGLQVSTLGLSSGRRLSRTPQDEEGFSISLVIVVLLVVISVVYFVFIKKPAGEINPLLIGDNAIYVSNTKPAIIVPIGFAILKDGGYVVIHEESVDRPGTIVGNSALLSQGENRDFEVMLSRKSVDGEALYAMLHFDNGDGVFNSTDDLPITDKEGNSMFMRFHISSGATEPEAISL